MSLNDFQLDIDNVLIRNRSILDQMTKLSDACARLNRHISKAATTCGCIQIDVTKQPFFLDPALSMDDIKSLMQTHIKNSLCDECKETIEKDLGRMLFYLCAIANSFNISLDDVIEKEKQDLLLLGKYSLR